MTLLDVSAAKAKERAARFASSFESTFRDGDAGVFGTKKEPACLSSRQADALAGFCLTHIPASLRDNFRYNVLNRISGCPGDAALKAAICAAAIEIAGFKTEQLRLLGIVEKNSDRIPGGGKCKLRGYDDDAS